MKRHLRLSKSLALCFATALAATNAWAVPAGYLKHTVTLNAPPIGLAFDNAGVLYALENAESGNATNIRVIQPDYTFGADLPVTGDDPNNFFVGGMTYDPVTDSLLITDNTADGRLYSVSKTGAKQTLATGIAAIAGVAVRSTGEIFVSTALGDNLGAVLQVDRTTGSTETVPLGPSSLDFGSGLAFDLNDDLLVQDADATTFQGRLHRISITEDGDDLQFGSLEMLLDGMQSGAGVAVDSEGDLFTTGSGGLYSVTGSPLAETSFDNNGNPFQFATAIDFDPGLQPFEPFAGPDAGRIALMADFGFSSQDAFVTIIEPSPPDANFDGIAAVDGADHLIWEQNFGTATGATHMTGDADGDKDADGLDFLVWQRQFDGLEMFSAARTVPEPTTAALFVVAFGSFVLRRGGLLP